MFHTRPLFLHLFIHYDSGQYSSQHDYGVLNYDRRRSIQVLCPTYGTGPVERLGIVIGKKMQCSVLNFCLTTKR